MAKRRKGFESRLREEARLLDTIEREAREIGLSPDEPPENIALWLQFAEMARQFAGNTRWLIEQLSAQQKSDAASRPRQHLRGVQTWVDHEYAKNPSVEPSTLRDRLPDHTDAERVELDGKKFDVYRDGDSVVQIEVDGFGEPLPSTEKSRAADSLRHYLARAKGE